MQYVIDQVRKAGVVVPLINNDAWSGGHNAPSTGLGAVDIYGHDNYPYVADHPFLYQSTKASKELDLIVHSRLCGQQMG